MPTSQSRRRAKSTNALRSALLLGVALALLKSAAIAAPDTCQDFAKIEKAERGLNLSQLMEEHRVPGMGLAVIHDYRIVCAKGYGVTEKGGKTPVTPSTLFLAGSISKPVAAAAALYLVQHHRLALEEDVNKKLRSWRVPESPFTQKQKVTLAELLDHTAGFTGGDFFPGYERGKALPALTQILDGLGPAHNDPVRVGFVPGSRWQYSGDGYLVVQQLISDEAGESFPEFVRTAIFEPLDMNSSTFEQPLPDLKVSLAASGVLMDGTPVKGGWHVNPETAAGGLWSTPTDLAKFAIEIALSAQGRANHVLSRDIAHSMLIPHWDKNVINILGTPEDPDRMGYGFFVGKDRGRFGHIGGNVGYQATLVMFAGTGDGAVIMTNSDVGLEAGNALLNRIAEEYQWHYTAPPPPG